jgi:hypothetical protein
MFQEKGNEENYREKYGHCFDQVLIRKSVGFQYELIDLGRFERDLQKSCRFYAVLETLE